MAKSPNLMLKAREILATPSHEGLEGVLSQLSTRQETTEYQSALALFNFCAAEFANCLTLKLLLVYRFSSNGAFRFQSIYLLSEILADLRNRNFELYQVFLYEIKPLLISCLKMKETQESEINILRRIVSCVAYDVMILDNDGWDELSDCILELANSDPVKAFHVFVDLPPVYARFIYRFSVNIVEKAEKVLRNPEKVRVEDWSLSLETVVKMGIQLLDTEMRFDMVKTLISLLVKSASNLVEKGMEQYLLLGLEDLEWFLSRDKNMYDYNKQQCDFVSTFMFKIRDLGTRVKEATTKIHSLVKPSHNPATNLRLSQTIQIKPQDHGAGLEREGFDHLKSLSPLEMLRIFASTDREERSRELAIRQLNLLLSAHTSNKEVIDISMMRELQPLLMSCLWEKEGISESMFKVLGEVVYHVAYEMMNGQDEIWYGLREYIASRSKTEFERAVYIFQCLTMWLDDDTFVNPMMKSLLPEISSRLNPPRELLVDNSCWVLAFVGAFCAAIHLIEISSDNVKDITDKMIDSVRQLVERKMEVGLVRRAFRDVESIVKKQEEWFGKSEYKFIKGLLWRLYRIKGMKMESKMVLWRINVFVNRGMTEVAKLLPDSEIDW